MSLTYTAIRCARPMDMSLEPTGCWQQAQVAEIKHFLPQSSAHRPRTTARLLYQDRALHLLFEVDDCYVRAVAQQYQDPVCRDSCAEFFVRPVEGKGYFNFEINCGGTLLLFYIEDETRLPPGSPREFKKYTEVAREVASVIKIAHSMPRIVDPEITTPTRWALRYMVPLSVFEHYVGALPPLAGQVWRGNFYKCGDNTSHPHWAAWSPVDEFNFHLPRCFGTINFAP